MFDNMFHNMYGYQKVSRPRRRWGDSLGEHFHSDVKDASSLWRAAAHAREEWRSLEAGFSSTEVIDLVGEGLRVHAAHSGPTLRWSLGRI